MALVSCRECGKQVSSEAAVCPHCGIKKPSPKGIGRFGVLVMALVGFIAFKMASPGSESSSRASSAPAALGDIDALALCQYALKRTAKDPEKADIPYVQNYGSGNEAYFAWGRDTKMARMRNGLGLEVAVSASCTVDRSTRKITSLTVEGASVL